MGDMRLSAADEGYKVFPIGRIRRRKGHVDLEIAERFRPGLRMLDGFSHVIVIWWAHLVDDEESRAVLTCEPPYAEGHLTGVFACRAEYRPNPIALTPSRVLSVDEVGGVVRINDIDALDGSPVLDLKAYFPVVDRVRDARIPDHLEGWPEWLPEEGLGLDP